MTVAATGVCEVKGLVYVAAMAPDEGGDGLCELAAPWVVWHSCAVGA